MASLPARIVAYLFLGIICAAGPVILSIVVVTGIERALFISSSASAQGVIVALRVVHPYRHSDRSRSPVFRFTTKDGSSFTVASNISQSPAPWQFGDQVPVLYQPGHPENAHIDSFVQLWEPQVILGIVGGAFSVIPLLIFVRRRRSRT
jgi:hypothetical protein